MVKAFVVVPLPQKRNTAFTTTTTTFTPTTSSVVTRLMVKFDGNKWIAESTEETSDGGYDALGTFLRYGPIPTLRRLVQQYEYDQAVLKFMYQEKCSRNVAQGNMDYYFRNPNDWYARRLQEEKLGKRLDYDTLDNTKLVLVVVWTSIVVVFAYRAIEAVQTGTIDWVRIQKQKTKKQKTKN